MHVTLAVNKMPTKGADEFFDALPELLKTAETWTIVSEKPSEVTIRSTATMSSVPTPPTFVLRKSWTAGSVMAQQIDQGWSDAQRAVALGPFIYLCLTSLSAFVQSVHVDC